MKILVTGASGFIGRNLVRRLVAEHDVHAVVRDGPQPGAPVGVEWIVHDLREPLDGARVPDRVDAVVHLAQSRRYKEFPDEAEDIFNVNVRSTLELLDYARKAGAGSFLLASTGGVYGSSFEALVESDPVSPIDFYRTSKYAAELLAANYEPFLHPVVFRFFFVYGPNQRNMLVPRLLESVTRGETITIDGPDGIRLNPIYIEDAIATVERALGLGRPAVINVAGAEVVTLRELIGLMGDVAGVEPRIELSGKPADGDIVGDTSRLGDLLGLTPTTSLRNGLQTMLDATRR
jgi:nucleoside-diphosphate-sugar epimerase